MADSLTLIKNRYDELCAKRDAVNKQIAPINERLEKLNSKIADAQKEVQELVAQREGVRGGQAWLDIKREIGKLAQALSGKLKAPEKTDEFLE